MLGLSEQHKFYFYTGVTDLRKGFDGLCGLVRAQMGGNPLDGSVYIFINRKRDKMKILVWEPNGFMLYYKRLETGTFELPKTNLINNKMELSWQTLMLMIQGISLQKIKQRKRYNKTG
jgi:transposase